MVEVGVINCYRSLCKEWIHECHWVCDKAASEQPKEKQKRADGVGSGINRPKVE